MTVYRPPDRPRDRPSAPQDNQCSISHFLASLGAQEDLYCTHIAHQCCDQLTAVFFLIHMKYVVFYVCHKNKILISNSPRKLKLSQCLQAGNFDFSHQGHALVTLYVQFLCSDWSRFDRWVHAENLCSMHLETEFTLTAGADRGLCQLVMILTVFFHWVWKWNSAAIKSLLSFMAGLFIRFLVFRLSKSEIRFRNGIVFVFHLAWCVRGLKSLKRFWPYLIVFSAARMVSLSNYWSRLRKQRDSAA